MAKQIENAMVNVIKEWTATDITREKEREIRACWARDGKPQQSIKTCKFYLRTKSQPSDVDLNTVFMPQSHAGTLISMALATYALEGPQGSGLAAPISRKKKNYLNASETWYLSFLAAILG